MSKAVQGMCYFFLPTLILIVWILSGHELSRVIGWGIHRYCCLTSLIYYYFLISGIDRVGVMAVSVTMNLRYAPGTLEMKHNTIWIGCQFIAGHSCTHIFTPRGNLDSPIYLWACFWEVDKPENPKETHKLKRRRQLIKHGNTSSGKNLTFCPLQLFILLLIEIMASWVMLKSILQLIAPFLTRRSTQREHAAQPESTQHNQSDWILQTMCEKRSRAASQGSHQHSHVGAVFPNSSVSIYGITKFLLIICCFTLFGSSLQGAGAFLVVNYGKQI